MLQNPTGKLSQKTYNSRNKSSTRNRQDRRKNEANNKTDHYALPVYENKHIKIQNITYKNKKDSKNPQSPSTYMSTTPSIYKLSNSVQQSSGRKLNDSQLSQLKKTQAYLQKHKIHEICNELVAKLLQTKPQKVKEQMIVILKKIKQKSHYFKKTDFQAMFDSFDVFGDKGNGQVPYIYLLQALGHINVVYTQQEFLSKYPQFKLEKGVRKSDFANIMDTEYKKKIQK